MNKAVFVTKLKDMKGDARLYRLTPPLIDDSWEDEPTSYEYVVVSAVEPWFGGGPETYIFPGTPEGGGDVVRFLELTGSFKGDLDHAHALRLAGYEIVGEDS